jgi:hypothetical protein
VWGHWTAGSVFKKSRSVSEQEDPFPGKLETLAGRFLGGSRWIQIRNVDPRILRLDPADSVTQVVYDF